MEPGCPLAIPCPKCGQKIDKTWRGLQAEPVFICPHCQAGIDAQQFIRKTIEQVEKTAREINGYSARRSRNDLIRERSLELLGPDGAR